MPSGYPMMASCEPAIRGSSSATLMSPNDSAQSIEGAGVEAIGGGGSRRKFGSGGDGGSGSGCAEHGSVSCMLRRNHGMTGMIQGLSDSTCSSSYVAHAPLHSQTSIVKFDRAVVLDNVDPLSYFLMSWRKDHDPFDLGIGSVADGTFAARQPTSEQLLLFRSHRLMQAEAVSIAMDRVYSSSASEKKRLGLIGKTVARKVREKLVEKTISTVKSIRALRRDGILHKQQEVINEERKICNRMIAAVFDSATRTLKETPASGCNVSSSSGCSGGSYYGSTSSGLGNISGNNNYYSTAAMEPGLGSESGNRLAFSPPALGSSSPFEYQQLATEPAWDGAANTSCVTMASLPPIAPPIITPDPPQRQSVMGQQYLITPQQLPIMHSPGGIVGSSSVFALTKMRDRLHHHAPLGFPGGFSNPMSHSVGESQSAARTPRLTGLFQDKQMNKKLPMVTKMGAKTPVGLRSAHSNRKGSRHRLTPQAKDILEGWLANHWLNPYPTEEEKFCLAQACKITVSQVNNWMMNVRVRRCRTKKIGVATGQGQITFANVPKAIEAYMPQGMAAAEAEHLLADRTTFMGTKGVTSTAIVGGSNGSPPEMSWASPRGGN